MSHVVLHLLLFHLRISHITFYHIICAHILKSLRCLHATRLVLFNSTFKKVFLLVYKGKFYMKKEKKYICI